MGRLTERSQSGGWGLPRGSQIHRLYRRQLAVEDPPPYEGAGIRAAYLRYELQELVGRDVPMLIAGRPGLQENEERLLAEFEP